MSPSLPPSGSRASTYAAKSYVAEERTGGAEQRSTRRNAGRKNATSKVALHSLDIGDQCRFLAGAGALGGVINEPIGTTSCFGFFGFLASLLPRNWPFAMGFSLQCLRKYSAGSVNATQPRPIIGRYAEIGGFIP
ncbi:hypothetical protein Tbd_2160 [Thiobacillus denitrificans ATCC 25259]|uniref:Uncharacterized protein n=1 Tax=Thiobacillus denitrificans (strain ATCC 25259 / T1) TaxID=292415 RepID=Q3SGY0_THIDA|nr:hypothetical protein Tbd_2160 [Thiobacillus denitrificans ATCC 25259]